MFSKYGKYAPAGIFTTTHFISIAVCVVLIALAIILTRKMKSKTFFTLLKVFSIALTVIEVIKMLWYVINGIFELGKILPLYFCSLFIYALWGASSRNRILKDIGMAYIASAGIIAGGVFLAMPTSSFTYYPVFHFNCIHSLVFHSIMIYCGIMVYVTKTVKFTWKTVFNYCVFCLPFMLVAVLINKTANINLMFINTPDGVPLPFLVTIYNFSSYLYTLLLIIVHLAMGPFMLGVNKLFSITTRKKKKVINTVNEEVNETEESNSEETIGNIDMEVDEELINKST
jgi:uncharacterized membrane protein YwaF